MISSLALGEFVESFVRRSQTVRMKGQSRCGQARVRKKALNDFYVTARV